MRLFIAVFTIGLLVGCTDNKKKEIDQISDEVILLHDEVMPLMDGLYQTRMKLQKLATTDSINVDGLAIESTIVQIKKAEDAMMNWMRNFNPSYEGANPDETIQYLLDQKATISAVSKQMKAAQSNGAEILKVN